MAHKTIEELEDEVKQRDRRIAELKNEIDELRERNQALRVDTQEWEEVFESWKEAFEMRLREDDVWVWSESVATGGEWVEKYVSLVRDYNKMVRFCNGLIGDKLEDGTLRDRGRPIAATDEQRAIVFESHAEGRSLREIADDAGIGLQTVRTLIGKIDGSDRTSRRLSKYRKAEIDRNEVTAWKARKRTRDALPKRLHEKAKKTTALIKEAKGLGRST